VFLVETVEEGHALQARGIESITLEGLLQDDDGAIHLKYYNLCCGKSAIEEEKIRTKKLIVEVESALKELSNSIGNCQRALSEVQENIKNQVALGKLPELETDYQNLIDEVEIFTVLIEETTTKRAQTHVEKEKIRIDQRNASSDAAKIGEKREQSLRKHDELKNERTKLQKKLDSMDLVLQEALSNLKSLGLSDENIEFIYYDVQDDAFKDQEGYLLTSKVMNSKLTLLIQEIAGLYDPSVNNETVRLVRVQEGHVNSLTQNLSKLKDDRDELDHACDDLLRQFRSHIKEIMNDYISEFEKLAVLLNASAKGKLIEVTPEPETWHIQLYIGYDGKEPVLVNGPHLSSGQKASTSLMILLAALSNNQNEKTTTPIMFLDEPKARVDDDRGNEIGQLLQVTDIQYFITHQQGESLKTIDWIDHAFTCSACEPGKDFANPLILKKRSRRSL
jgi:chromosome segregation ATPase